VGQGLDSIIAMSHVGLVIRTRMQDSDLSCCNGQVLNHCVPQETMQGVVWGMMCLRLNMWLGPTNL
jgi:hypothetical protein